MALIKYMYRNFACITRKKWPKITPKDGVRTHTHKKKLNFFGVKCAKCSETDKNEKDIF